LRYSPALQTLGCVVADEFRALLGALLVVLILLLLASAGMYLLEARRSAGQVRLHSRSPLVGALHTDNGGIWRRRTE